MKKTTKRVMSTLTFSVTDERASIARQAILKDDLFAAEFTGKPRQTVHPSLEYN